MPLLDAAGNKIYLTCTITYVVKNDPKKEVFKIPTAGVFYLSDEGVVEKFEVYLDPSPVFTRISEVAGA